MEQHEDNDKEIQQLKSMYSLSKKQRDFSENKDLKKAMKEAKSSFDKMKKVQDQLNRAYAEISRDDS